MKVSRYSLQWFSAKCVYPFKPPTVEDLDHHFLWRTAIRLPARGHIGIFNRSHYEEVLVVRVHPDMLARQKLPDEFVTKNNLEGAL